MKGPKSALMQRIEYAAYRLALGLVRRASDETLARWGTRVGRFAARVLRRRDRLAMRNLQATFPGRPEGDLRAILDECWSHFGREMFSLVRTQQLSVEEVAERCPFVNRRILDDARSRGKGVLLLSGHFGGWEIGGLAIMTMLDRVTTVTRRFDNELLERDLARMRARSGVEVVDRSRAARALMKALAGNGVVVLLTDQAVVPTEGVLVPFLGRGAWTTDAPAKLAARSGSAIVFSFCIPEGTRHRLEFDEAIYVDELSEEERDPVALTRRINDVLSRRILERPDLYWWMHDRWKGEGAGRAT